MKVTTKPELTAEETEYVAKLREARRNARKAARSGHPGRRAEAQRVLAKIPGLIAVVYRRAEARA